MRNLEQEYMQHIESNRQLHYDSGQEALHYITNSTAKYHGRVVRTLYIPKMFEEHDIANFRSLLKTLYGIFDKVIDRYLMDEEYRRLFGYEKRLEELILLPALYPAKIPVARIDIFYDEITKDFKFCEFNTDGTSAMNEDRELNKALKKTLAYRQFAKNHHINSFELFDTLAAELKAIYDTTEGSKEHPHVAITDFMDCATENEFRVVAESLGRIGCTTEICEIRNLTFDGRTLYSPTGKPIDVIYRRAVTCDIMKHYDQIQPFVQAVKAGAVCLLGDFRTQIVHNKIFYKVVQMPQTMEMLTPEEQQYVKDHFPYTQSFEKDLVPLDLIVENREKWILKPEDSYGSKGVFAGVEYTQKEWEELVVKQYGSNYIVQEFCIPYRSVNIDLMKQQDAPFREYSNITGLYVYNGTFYGIYSRIAECSVISTQYSEMALATIQVK